MVAPTRSLTTACLLALAPGILAGGGGGGDGEAKTCGVYRDRAEFIRGTPLVAIPCMQEERTIWPQGFLQYRDIVVAAEDSTLVLPRDHIWGYRDHYGRLHRVMDGRHFRVIAKEGIVLYHLNSPTNTRYHFSRDLSSAILPLTRRNLREVFGTTRLGELITRIPRNTWLHRETREERFLLQELVLMHGEDRSSVGSDR
jgi:hypothetical protein